MAPAITARSLTPMHTFDRYAMLMPYRSVMRCRTQFRRGTLVAAPALLGAMRRHGAVARAVDDDDDAALYWEDRRLKGRGMQYCRGCGSRFEGTFSPESRVTPSKYPGKPAGRLCPRCGSLQCGEVLAASDGVRDAEPLEFEKAVAPVIALRPAVVLMILDATDFDGTLIADALRNVLRQDTEVILALSKADLLPRLDDAELDFVRRRVRERGIEVTAAHAVSAITGLGMQELAATVVAAAECRDVADRTAVKRNVVVCGAASVGKSTLINSLARHVLRLSHAALPARARGPAEHVAAKALAAAGLTESHLPGTTLGAVAVKCFASAHHSLYDTPGVLLPQCAAAPHARRRLAVCSPHHASLIAALDATARRPAGAGSWSALVLPVCTWPAPLACDSPPPPPAASVAAPSRIRSSRLT